MGTKQKNFEEIAAKPHFSFEAIEVDQDHIHCLVKSEPKLSPLSIVRRLKRHRGFHADAL